MSELVEIRNAQQIRNPDIQIDSTLQEVTFDKPTVELLRKNILNSPPSESDPIMSMIESKQARYFIKHLPTGSGTDKQGAINRTAILTVEGGQLDKMKFVMQVTNPEQDIGIEHESSGIGRDFPNKEQEVALTKMLREQVDLSIESRGLAGISQRIKVSFINSVFAEGDTIIYPYQRGNHPTQKILNQRLGQFAYLYKILGDSMQKLKDMNPDNEIILATFLDLYGPNTTFTNDYGLPFGPNLQGDTAGNPLITARADNMLYRIDRKGETEFVIIDPFIYKPGLSQWSRNLNPFGHPTDIYTYRELPHEVQEHVLMLAY